MKIIVYGFGDVVDQLMVNKEYQIVAFLDATRRRCIEGYNRYKVIHPIELKNSLFDAIVVTDGERSDGYDAYAKIEQLRLYGIEDEKIYLLINGQVTNLKSLNWESVYGAIPQYEVMFQQAYPKNVLNTHQPYIMERCSKRKLYIYGVGCEAANITNMCDSIGLKVEKYITDNPDKSLLQGITVVDPIDLVYEEQDKYFVIVADETESYGVSRKKLLNIGLREDIDFTYCSEIPGTDEPFYYDLTLSYNRVRDTIEGFEIFGDTTSSNAMKIVVLGGSTTESQLFFVRGWVPFFAEYLRNHGIAAKVYCGGISGYTSTQELLKFERDVLQLEPDIVISYSGVNDLYMFPTKDEERYKKPFITKFQMQFINQVLDKLAKLQYGLPSPDIPDWEKGGKGTVYYGLNNEKSAPKFWIDNMRMMHALSKEFNIEFFSFFQPFRFNGFYTSTSEQEVIHSRRDPSCNPPIEGEKLYGRKEEVKELKNLIKQYDYITDLSEIFINEKNVYYDSVHVYERGNQIIARHICDVILQYIRFKEGELHER